MRWPGVALIPPLLVVTYCSDKANDAEPSVERRGIGAATTAPLMRTTRPIDWDQSAGIFIGIQKFTEGSDLAVAYAADDAVDLTFLFTHELHLLRLERTCLLLSGVPSKKDSLAHLALLRDHLLVDERPDAEAILHAVDRASQRIGPDGILIISFATHGLTYRSTASSLSKRLLRNRTGSCSRACSSGSATHGPRGSYC
jgi:hypothetical protein